LKFGWPMTKSCDLFTTDRPYVTLYDAIYKKGSRMSEYSGFNIVNNGIIDFIFVNIRHKKSCYPEFVYKHLVEHMITLENMAKFVNKLLHPNNKYIPV
jgi:hypothetical protein